LIAEIRVQRKMSRPDDQPDLTDRELAFFRSMVWEVVHLEMKGPAHRLALEQGFTEREMIRLWIACGKRSNPGMYAEERMPHLGWPWPGQTPTEVLDHLGQSMRRSSP
jgi:hypothetical protein